MKHSRLMNICVAIACLTLLALAGPSALAQGSTDVPLAPVSNADPGGNPYRGHYCVAAGGASLYDSEAGTIALDITGEPAVAYLLWSGTSMGEHRDSTVTIQFNDAVATEIKADNTSMSNAPNNVTWYAYSAALAVDGRLESGLNVVTITGLDLEAGHGVGLIVLSTDEDRCPMGTTEIQVGNDLFFHGWTAANGPNSDIACVDFSPRRHSEKMDFWLVVAGIESADRSDTIWFASGQGDKPATLVRNPAANELRERLQNEPGTEFDLYHSGKDDTISIEIPAGQTWACFQIESPQQPATGRMQGISAAWTGLVVRVEEEKAACPDDNFSWVKPCNLADIVGSLSSKEIVKQAAALTDEVTVYEASQSLDREGQSRWYRFPIQPNDEVVVTLTNLPANYDLTLYKDVLATFYDTIVEDSDDLLELGAEFAPDMFSPDMFSPDMFSPDMFSPDMFSPDMFSPDMFSPDMFSPDMFSPDMFSPDMFSPDMFSPDMFSPDMFSPDMFSPDMFSPDMFSPDMFSPDLYDSNAVSPEAFADAQIRSLIGASGFPEKISEGIRVKTWQNAGNFYTRVRGRNGAYQPETTYDLTVTVSHGVCSNIDPSLPDPTLGASAGGYGTIILVDFGRLNTESGDDTELRNRLNELAQRPEVNGVIVDVSMDALVAAANQLADRYPACPFAKNLVAYGIKGIIDRYRAINPLEYIVIIGNDDVIPFFRHPDQAGLGNEANYVPPVRDSTASQASLKLSYAFGQDRYGSSIDVSLRTDALPIPDLAVGRLVESSDEIMAMLNAYLDTPDGTMPTPTSALVTGYDFLADAATAVKKEVESGIDSRATTLITDREISPLDPRSWTAEDLGRVLSEQRYDVMYLAGHFSSGSMLAADYSTRLTAAEVAAMPVDMTNVLVFSGGCHSGYNLVNGHAIDGISPEPDWAQAFARKGATLIAGTGYQYGHTDFVEYSERLYLEFSRQLLQNSGPVSVGKALVAAKQAYLADTAQLRPIHEKSVIIATLFGLPMMKIDMPAGRQSPEEKRPEIIQTSGFSVNPGERLGLRAANIQVRPTLTRQTKELVDPINNQRLEVVYFTGDDGVLSNPAEPTLPVSHYSFTDDTQRNNATDAILRGVGFLGGDYTDFVGVTPLAGSAATEIRGVHPIFISDTFFPVRPWQVNYFDALVGGEERLMVLPAQYRTTAADQLTGTMRVFDDMQFRLFYSDYTETFESGAAPATSAPPTISRVRSEVYEGDGEVEERTSVNFIATVTGNPNAGLQEVWVTYTSVGDDPLASSWNSIFLSQSVDDSTLWLGSIELNDSRPEDIRYIVQSVNGVGLVSLNANRGEYFTPGEEPIQPPLADVPQPASEPTTLTVLTIPDTGVYGTRSTVRVRLTSRGEPLPGQRLQLVNGRQVTNGTTDANGVAEITQFLLGNIGDTQLHISYGGIQETEPPYRRLSPASLTEFFEVLPQETSITLGVAPISRQSSKTMLNSVITASLTGADGRAMAEKTIAFQLEVEGTTLTATRITDLLGKAELDLADFSTTITPSAYTVQANFGIVVMFEDGTSVDLSDERYEASTAEEQFDLISEPERNQYRYLPQIENAED